MRVVVVGSGLGAVGSIRALLAHGIRPIVLDIGETLTHRLVQLRQSMAEREPENWHQDEWIEVSRSDSLEGQVVPRKLVMGSDYFYANESSGHSNESGRSHKTPPWSPARGGFSVGWGAAALPPASSDLSDWPISHDSLLKYARLALDGIPVSEPKDQLSEVFGTLRPNESSLMPLSDGQARLLKALQKPRKHSRHQQTLVGQSRLLTQAAEGLPDSCRRCGLCSSGCVYGSIYSAEQDIERWIANGDIDYRPGTEVFRVVEEHSHVVISYRSPGNTMNLEADRVFLAAGAVSTARILANSAPHDLARVSLQRTGGVLEVYAGVKRFKIAWPKVNTQTSHVIEIFRSQFSPYWAHVQLGQPNELVLRRLGIEPHKNTGIRQRVVRSAAGHVITTMLNLNSFHGPRYDMKLGRRADTLADVETSQVWSDDGKFALSRMSKELSRFLRSVGFFRIPFIGQDSAAAQGYHFGASFPMTLAPTEVNESDILGRPFGWKLVHIVDTSVLPRIPSTGIGLVTMSNSYRIAANSLREPTS